MHGRAAQLLLVGVLVDGHLDQRWPAQEDLGLIGHQHRVVAQAGHVGPASRGGAEHQRDGGDPGRGQAGQAIEGRPAGNEDVGLAGQVGAAGFGQVDQGQVVGRGHLLGSQTLGHGGRARRAAPNGGVVGADHAHGALDQADPGDQAAAQGVLGAPPGQRAELQERRVGVHQQVDALAHQQASPLAMSGHVARPAALEQLILGRPHLGQAFEHGGPVGLVIRGAPIDAGRRPPTHGGTLLPAGGGTTPATAPGGPRSRPPNRGLGGHR